MSREHTSATRLTRCLTVWAAASAVLLGGVRLLAPLAPPHGGAEFASLLTSLAAVALIGCLLWAWLATTVVVLDAARGTATHWAGCPGWLRRGVLLACGALLTSAPLAAHADPTAGQPPQPVPAQTPAVDRAPVSTAETPEREQAAGALRGAPDGNDLDGIPLPELPTTPAQPTIAPSPSPSAVAPSPAPTSPTERGPTAEAEDGAPAPDPKPEPGPRSTPAPSTPAPSTPAPSTATPPTPAVPPQAERPMRAAPGPTPSTTPRPAKGHTVVVLAVDSLWSIASQALPSDASTAEVDRAWRTLWQHNRDVIGADPDLIRPGQQLDLTPMITTTPQEER